MKVTIEFVQEDFANGESLPEVLGRYFGDAELHHDGVDVALSPGAAAHRQDVPEEPAAPEPAGDAPQPEPATEQPAAPEQPAPQPKRQVDVADAGRFTIDDALGLDSAGIPWAEEIHSSSKKTVKSGPRKGRWAKKRGLPEEELEAGEAHLARMYGPELPAGDAPQPEPTPQPEPALPGDSQPAAPQPEPALPGDSQPAAAPAPSAEQRSWTLPEFIQAKTKAVGEGKLTDDQVQTVLLSHEVPSIPMLSLPQHQTKMAAIAQELGL